MRVVIGPPVDPRPGATCARVNEEIQAWIERTVRSCSLASLGAD